MADGQGTTQLADPAAQTSPLVAVDVVVVAYNSRDTLRACVEPLVRVPWVSVTVVDNASPDDSTTVVADLPVHTISAPRNGGFAYGCNLGMAAGTAEFVLFLNPDAWIESASLDMLMTCFGPTPRSGAWDRGRSATAASCTDTASLPAPSLHVLPGPGPAQGRAARELGRRGDPGAGGVYATGYP